MKAQMVGQIFIYILAVILVAFILIYGYNAVQTFKTRAEQVSYIKFKTDVESAIKSISSDYGSIKKAEFLVPSGYREVCFIDLDHPVVPSGHPIIKDSVESGVKENLFLVREIEEESFYVGKIEVAGNSCIEVKAGKIKVQLEGKGDHAIISEWE